MAAVDYIVLVKPRVIWLLILSAVAGYVVASGGLVDPVRLVQLIIVGTLSTGGAAAFNHYWERDIDSLMSRTKSRPLPSGRVSPRAALAESIVLSVLGISLSQVWLGALATIYVVLGWVAYAILYTIVLKRRSWVNILVGGFAGNAALLAGWSVARAPGLEAIFLSMAVYIWIPAHIWSLVIRAREDYLRAGVKMLPLLIKERSAFILVSILNAASGIYMLILYALLLWNPVGMVFLSLVTLFSVYISIRTILNPTPEMFWKMFKISSPVLAIFLIISMATALASGQGPLH